MPLCGRNCADSIRQMVSSAMCCGSADNKSEDVNVMPRLHSGLQKSAISDDFL
jgi:hypothetical protein